MASSTERKWLDIYMFETRVCRSNFVTSLKMRPTTLLHHIYTSKIKISVLFCTEKILPCEIVYRHQEYCSHQMGDHLYGTKQIPKQVAIQGYMLHFGLWIDLLLMTEIHSEDLYSPVLQHLAPRCMFLSVHISGTVKKACQLSIQIKTIWFNKTILKKSYLNCVSSEGFCKCRKNFLRLSMPNQQVYPVLPQILSQVS